LADTPAGRLLALRVVQQSPVARIVPAASSRYIVRAFSPDGEWLAGSDFDRVTLLRRSGGEPRTLFQYPSKGVNLVFLGFQPATGALVTDLGGDVHLWSLPDGRELLRAQLGHRWSHPTDRGLFTETPVQTPNGKQTRLALWPYEGDRPPLPLGTFNGQLQVDSVKGLWFAYAEGHRVYLRSVDDWQAPARQVLEFGSDPEDVSISEDGSRLAVCDASGRIEIWSTRSPAPRPERILNAPGTLGVRLDRTGQRLVADAMIERRPAVLVFNLADPVGTQPIVIARSDTLTQSGGVLDPSGQWISTASPDAELWWIGGSRPRVLEPGGDPATNLAFSPDGRWLLATHNHGRVTAFPMKAGDEARTISQEQSQWRNVLAIAPSGRQAAVGLNRGRVLLIDLESRQSQRLAGFPESAAIGAVAFGDNGRLVAAAAGTSPREEKVIRVFDLQGGTVRIFGPLPGAGNGRAGTVWKLRFVGTDRILALVEGTGLVSVDLHNGQSKVVASRPNARVEFSADGTSGVGLEASPATGAPASVFPFQISGGALPALKGYEVPKELALDPSGRIVATGGVDGAVRVGPLKGGDPHILIGHRGAISALAFSPDGRWLASASNDGTLRIWPVPDVSRTPFHKLPTEELLTRLRSYTNLRAVPDDSATGYVLKPGPFPGWATPPIE